MSKHSSGSEPRHARTVARSRTEAGQVGRRWVWGVAVAVVATAATIAAVALVGGDVGTTGGGTGAAGTPSVTASAATRSPSAGPSTPAGSPGASADSAVGGTVPVYYVADTSHGVRLYREFHHARSRDTLTDAVDQAVSTRPDDPDYRTPWPAGTRARAVTYNGDVLAVDLDGTGLRTRPAGMPEQVASMAVEQVLYTAQAALGKGRVPVQLLLDRSHTDTVLGVPAAEPLAQGDPLDVLAQVWVIDPAQGATVATRFRVSGLAAAFEAQVVWELRQGDTVVRHGTALAKECCTMAPYSFTVEAPPGRYTLLVRATDPSGGEGPAPWQDTKDVTVR